MSTTTLFTAASTYAVGLRHVQFHLRNSTATTGAVTDGWGEWYVYRGGAELTARRAIGVLDYGGEFQNGDLIRCRFVDRAKNAGAWVDYTVAVSGSASYVQYVSAAGSDSNAGTTEGLPKLTLAAAWTAMMANLGAGQVGTIYCRRGDTFTQVAGLSFSGSVQRHVIVQDYGSSGSAKPILQWPTNTNGFSVGEWGSMHLRNLDMNGQDAGGGDSGAINYTRFAPNGPLDLLITGCLLRNWTWSVRITGNNGENGTNWTDGRADFVGVADTEMDNAGSIHVFSSFAQRYTFFRDVFMGDTNGENNANIWRISRWKHHFLQRATWKSENNASLRCQTGPALGATDTFGPGSWLDCVYTSLAVADQHFLANHGFGRTAPDGAGAGYATDLRFVGCRWNSGAMTFEGVEVTRVQLWACEITGGWFRTNPNSGSTPGTVHSIEYRDCIRIDQETDGHTTFWFQGASSFYDAGSITVTGCAHYVRAGLGTRMWIQASQMTMAETITKIAASDGNRIGLNATGSYNWVQATDDTWPLSAWQSGTSFDDNSSVTTSVGTANFVNVGTVLELVDFHRTASSSFLNDAGFVRLGFDGDGLIRSASTPDAGPHEYGAAAYSGPGLPGGSPSTLVRLKNTGSTTFTGWARINTDQTVAAAYGVKDDVQFVKGNATGRDTTAVDLYVTMDAGTELILGSLIPDTATPPSPVTPTPSFAGGTPTVAGVAMTQVSTATDGQATVEEWKVRVGRWVVRMWTRWYPNEPWIHAEVVVTFSDPTYTAGTVAEELRQFWPGHLMTWGTGVSTIAGRTAASGDLIASGTAFGDGQSRAFPVLWVFPNRLRGDGTADNNSIAVLQSWSLAGHGIANLWRDGNPYVRPDAVTYTATQKPGSLARLHNWTASPLGITARSENSGRQDDQVFVGGEAMVHVEATTIAYLEGFRWAARPCHHLESDGELLNLAGHPQLRLWNSRPHPISIDKLGKTFQLPDDGSLSTGWSGADIEHWFFNMLMAGARYTGSPALQWLMEAQAVVYLFMRYPSVPQFGSFATVQSTRDLVWEPILVVHLWENLTDRTLATTVRDRFYARCSSSGPIRPYITAAPFGDIWDVRFQPTSPTGSIPFAPGWIPWQQGPACWAMDYALRAFTPELDIYASDLTASALRVMDDCYNFEGGRWVEYERQELPPPDGQGRESRSGFFTVDWFPPCIAYILRVQPSNTTAQAIWAQMLNDTLTGSDPARRRWLPPNSVAPTGGGNNGTANASMLLEGAEVSATGEVSDVDYPANVAIVLEGAEVSCSAIRIAAPVVAADIGMDDALVDGKADSGKGEQPQPPSPKKSRNQQMSLSL